MARTDVLLVPASSAACDEAVAAIVAGTAEVVLVDDEAELLPVAMAAVEAGFAVVSRRVVDGAAAMPPLSDHDRGLLHLVGAGASNRAVAEALGTSVGSVKAATVRLARDLSVDGRAGLVELAKSLGC